MEKKRNKVDKEASVKVCMNGVGEGMAQKHKHSFPCKNSHSTQSNKKTSICELGGAFHVVLEPSVHCRVLSNCMLEISSAVPRHGKRRSNIIILVFYC